MALSPLSPKKSGETIARLSNNIEIKKEGIQKLGDTIINAINDGSLSIENFSQNNHHPKCDVPTAIDWIFVVDTLNFCFWSPEKEPGWTVNGYTGYFALCAAINRALSENYDITNPKYYSTITMEDLSHILRSDTPTKINLLQDRLDSLHSVGKTLLEKFDGSFKNCVIQSENSAVNLLKIIVNNFECFKDEADYKGHRVALYKRAQILIGDIWACFRNKGLGYFKDINELTMFADYRVPQSLLYFNVFKYNEKLMEALKSNRLFINGEEFEVEIRGCSIHAVELINEYVQSKLAKDKYVNAILIDHFLWDFRRAHAKEIIQMQLPFHRTFCIYY